MKKKKRSGFTLVELLAVIVILAIILVISVPSLINNINNKKVDASNIIKQLVITAARTYIIDNSIEIPVSVPIDDLCDYLDCPIIDPYTNKEIVGYILVDAKNRYNILESETGVKLTINPNGGNSSQTLQESYLPWTTLSVEQPTKSGFTFSHWEVVRGNGIVNGNSVTIGDADTEIYAIWISWPILTVDYDDGIPSDTLNQKYKTGEIIQLKNPTKEGYKFVGWKVVSGNGIISIGENGYTLTIGTEDTEIKALWKKELLVTFNANGGIVSETQKTVTYGEEYGNLPIPEKEGYTFSGWAIENGEFVIENSIVKITEDHTLYAQWNVKTYTIRFHANGGVGAMPDQTIKYDSVVALSKNIFTRDEYTFFGWALTEDGEKKFNDKESVVNLQLEGTLDLYAIWKQNSYRVSFDYNDGKGTADEMEVLYGEPYGVLPDYPTLSNKLFIGWYTEKTGGTKVYANTIVNKKVDHTLYAHWEDSPSNTAIEELTIKNIPDENNDGVMDAIYLNFKCASSFEKYNIPLRNLIVGQKYKLSFTASNNASFGQIESGYKNSIYGSIITKEGTLSAGSIKDESVADGGLIAQWSDRTKGDDWLHGPFNLEMTFIAEASTMYWTWDFGLMKDGILYDFNFNNIRLEPVIPEINFGDKKLILYTSSKAQVLNDNSDKYSTNFIFDGDSYAETVYYSITGLTSGSTYTITFDHTFSGALIDDSSKTSQLRYEYGCGIMNSAPTKYGSFMSDIGTYASNTFVMKSATGNTEKVTLTFTATGDTAYWVWNMANCSDSINGTIDVKVTNFSAIHSSGESVTYYMSPG